MKRKIVIALLLVGILALGVGAQEFRRGILLVPNPTEPGEAFQEQMSAVDQLLFDEWIFFDWAETLEPESLRLPKILVLLGEGDLSAEQEALITGFQRDGGRLIVMTDSALAGIERTGQVLLQSIQEVGRTAYWYGFSPLSATELEPMVDEAQRSVRTSQNALRSMRGRYLPQMSQLEEDLENAEFAVGLARKYLEMGENIRVVHYLTYAQNLANHARYATVPNTGAQGRGFWLDAGALSRLSSERAIIGMLDQMAAAGINMLFPEVYAHKGTIFPGEFQDPSFRNFTFDPMEVLTREAKARGMEVHAWVWVFCAGYSHQAGPVLTKFPQWAEKDRNGNIFSDWSYGTPWLAQSNPEVHAFLTDLYMHIIETYQVDGIHLDYIRYNETEIGQYGFSDFTVAKFKEETGINAWDIKEGTEESKLWSLWREEQVTTFVRNFGNTMRAYNPDLKLSAAVFPDPTRARYHVLQNWGHWVANKYLDFLVTMSYSGNVGEFNNLIIQAFNVTKDQIVFYPGAGVWVNTPEALAFQAESARRYSTSGIVFFALAHMNNKYYEEMAKGPFKAPAVIPHAQPLQTIEIWLNEALRSVAGNPQATEVSDALRSLIALIPAELDLDALKEILAGAEALNDRVILLRRTPQLETGEANAVLEPLMATVRFLRALTYQLTPIEYIPPTDPTRF